MYPLPAKARSLALSASGQHQKSDQANLYRKGGFQGRQHLVQALVFGGGKVARLEVPIPPSEAFAGVAARWSYPKQFRVSHHAREKGQIDVERAGFSRGEMIPILDIILRKIADALRSKSWDDAPPKLRGVSTLGAGLPAVLAIGKIYGAELFDCG